MGRCRWRVTIAAFLLLLIQDTQCQDENDFDYPLVERSFAQVQPPLFANSRPSTFFEHGDSYRITPAVQQSAYSQSSIRLPSANYNQNPSPFQLPTGRSQSGAQYYINQPDFTQQRQRFRPSLPYNFQFHPASTKRPEIPPIHSIAYQNDPSKPETFLGQITLNNPDIDYLQNSRFRNIPFDGSNSLKSNVQSAHPVSEDDVENEDLFDRHRVTTYNPTRLMNKQSINNKPSRFSHFDPLAPSNRATPGNKPYNGKMTPKQQKPNNNIYQSSSTEYKPLLDIEPLLEDEISDISTFRELMKNTQGSFDVQVIKSNQSNASELDDSKPDASFMESDNLPQEITSKPLNTTTARTTTTSTSTTTTTNSHHDDETEEIVDDSEYVEYYDETESSEVTHTTIEPTTTDNSSDIYDEYDATEEPENTAEEIKSNSTGTFDVLVMKPVTTMVEDDNFKQFIDTAVIDQTDLNGQIQLTSPNSYDPVSEDVTSIETPSILGQEVVSVVTTKSVVNGTISIPEVTLAPSTTKIVAETESDFSSLSGNESSLPVTTENWIVVASVQTSRSVSGARFLPFPTVEQEEKKQVLTDEKDLEDEDSVTRDPKLETHRSNGSPSTENINDKLDSIQSELSSAVLSGNLNNENKHIELITESTTERTTTTKATTTTTTTTTTTAIPNIFTLKSTQPQSTTVKSSPEPLPVMVKKFTPRMTTSTTPKPQKKLVTIRDELPISLLPAGYKPRLSFKDKRTSTTTPSTTTTKMITTSITKSPNRFNAVPIINSTQGRSSGINTKNKVIILDDKSLLPKEYKPKEHKLQEDLFRKAQTDDINKFLPSGYKPQITEAPGIKEISKDNVVEKVQKINITSFLPKGFSMNATTSEKPKIESKLPINIAPVDITSFLPPGYKSNDTENKSKEISLDNIKIADVANLLPPGFVSNETEEAISSSPTIKAPGGIKLVFPSRPGSKANRKITTPKSLGPPPVTPKIQKGWPTRASTEFTGWPSPSTTPFSIEKLLEAQRNATATSPLPEVSTETTTRRTTTTTTTTPVPPPPTTPGVCRKDCDIAATIKIVAGVKWIPELLDHHTDEWQRLADDVKNELNSVYSRSDYLKKWYKGIRIEGFSQGSVLVDYFIELNNVEERVDTGDLKKMFHKSLQEAKPGSVLETVAEASKEEFDPDVMLGDQPDEERMKKSNEQMTKTIDKSAGKLEIGKFVMDPAYTEFIVLPKRELPSTVAPDEEAVLPQWGIAVIVIAMASLLFVVIFGVTVLVNRQKNAKAKTPIPLSEDMLRELDKSHMGGYDDMHQLKERELPYLPSGKRMSTAFIEQLAYPNPGDSWRSEWTPQLQKYMQHYTPDSGRGSQTYGPVANGYGYSGSQIYGQTGGGSQAYGYTGEYQRSHYPRRRSDYDSNF